MARILLADDDAVMLDLARRALVADGHAVTSCEDGNDALMRLAERPEEYDLLVTDIQMPLLDGIRLADRAATIKPDLRILLMSGYREQLDRAEGLRGAVVATLLKPFSMERLQGEVRRMLSV